MRTWETQRILPAGPARNAEVGRPQMIEAGNAVVVPSIPEPREMVGTVW